MPLTISDLKTLMQESGMSPEELGGRLDISGMTIRRWLRKPASSPLSPIYSRALEETAHQLLSDGILSEDSQTVRNVLVDSRPLPFQAALKNLGLSMESVGGIKNGKDGPRRLIQGLKVIGSDERKNERVRAKANASPASRVWVQSGGNGSGSSSQCCRRPGSSPRTSWPPMGLCSTCSVPLTWFQTASPSWVWWTTEVS